MIIKSRKREATSWTNIFSTLQKNSLLTQRDQIHPEKTNLKQLAFAVLGAIFLCAFFAAYMINKNPQMIIKIANARTAEKVFKAITLGPFRWIDSHIRGADLPDVYIDIKFKFLRKLQEKRKESLQRGVLITTKGDYVPAKIRHEGRTVKVKMRLKGDWARNSSDKKMSFRVQVKNGDHFLGMRRFSLQNPKARIYDGDRLFFEAIKREGILAPRHSFVDLTVNGTKMGIMALEEHFSKELLESQRRRAGVILKFDESMVWLAESEASKGRGFEGVYDNYKNATIKPFRLNRIKSSKKLTNELESATRLLRAFVDGALKPSQVFDPILMGRFIAVGDFWGAWHGLRWHNLRFYYNAITGYLEPIGFDAGIAYNQKPAHDPTAEPIVTKILDDSIRKVYMETLERLIEEAKDGTTAHWVEGLTNNNLKALHKEYFWLEGVDLDLLTQWAEQKLNSVKRKDLLYPKILQVYLVKNEMDYYLELQNPLPYDVIVTDIQLLNVSKNNPVKLQFEEASLFPFILASSEIGGMPTEKKIHLQRKDIDVGTQFMVTANIKGDREIHAIKSLLYFSNAIKPILPQPTLAKTLSQHSYLKVDKKRNILRVKSGQWQVNSWLVVPEGFELLLSEGTTLNFKSSAGLLARGPVTIKGTKDSPVILQGMRNSTKANYWQGIFVMNSESPSHWSHVKIKNTKGIKNNDWVVSAGVTFYESDVYLKNVTFSENRCEDALNIIRSTFDLMDVDIKNAISDGLDADFSNGVVTGGIFKNLGFAGGGDGIDLSGSRITITGTRFLNIADKAISVGEESYLISDQLSIQKVGVGIVSKDGSHTTVQNSEVMETKIAGLMAYTKKPVYPLATLHAKDITFKNSTPNALVQKGNEVMLGGILVEPSEFDIKNLYKTSMKPGLR
ncbi:MAG: CotH kinase family protein [Nitrospinaceae bacterium]|nr:CotH kinase family protein [Nitrospinaceae bacterium]